MDYKNDVEALDSLRAKFEELKNEITKVIYGQDEIITQVLISLFSRGHVLLIGVPGLAKTLLVTTIAKILGLKYNRIQFTPDLMPSDIIGTEILDKERQFKFIQGPLFANIILADEINRTPPKTHRLCSKQCRKGQLLLQASVSNLKNHFLFLLLRIRLNRKVLTRFPKRSLTGLCFQFGSIIQNLMMNLPS